MAYGEVSGDGLVLPFEILRELGEDGERVYFRDTPKTVIVFKKRPRGAPLDEPVDSAPDS